MPSSASWRSWSSRRRSASRPACTPGCSVFTRPSSDSGKPVTRGDIRHRVAGVADRRRRRPGRDDLDAGAGERLGEPQQVGLVAHRDERAADGDDVAVAVQGGVVARAGHGGSSVRDGEDQTDAAARSSSPVAILRTTSISRRRSTGLMRSCRVCSSSPGSTGTRSCAMIGPRVDAVVDDDDARAGLRDAGGERVAHAVGAGELGQVGGVRVDDARRPRVDDARRAAGA